MYPIMQALIIIKIGNTSTGFVGIGMKLIILWKNAGY